jgi:hypothetical protein
MVGSMVLSTFLAACQSVPPDSPGTVRDSADIEIIESVSPVWEEGDTWRLSSVPALDIGVSEGDAAYELHEPRDVVRLSDGRIVVANSGSVEIRYYASDGTHLLDAGGRGGGPGEFQRLSWLGKLENDSVVVYDQTQRRLTIFDPDGHYVRAVSLSRIEGRVYPMIGGRHADGSYLGDFRVRPPRGAELPTGLGRDSTILLQFDPDGVVIDTLGPFPNRVIDVQMRAVGSSTIRGPADVAFSPRTVWTLGAGHTYVGNSDAYEFRVLDAGGRLERLIRRQHEPVRVAESDRELLVGMWLDIHAGRLDNPEVQWFIKTLEDSPLPEVFPVFDPMETDDRGRRIGRPLLVDALGNLWAAQYRPLDEHVPQWDVFDGDGRFLGTVSMPERFLVTEIGSDYVLGTWRSELSVGHVRMYELIKD